MVIMQLGPKLEIVMAELGWKPAELARRSKVNAVKLSRIINEGREATPAELVRIHRATGVPLVWLADDGLEDRPASDQLDYAPWYPDVERFVERVGLDELYLRLYGVRDLAGIPRVQHGDPADVTITPKGGSPRNPRRSGNG